MKHQQSFYSNTRLKTTGTLLLIIAAGFGGGEFLSQRGYEVIDKFMILAESLNSMKILMHSLLLQPLAPFSEPLLIDSPLLILMLRLGLLLGMKSIGLILAISLASLALLIWSTQRMMKGAGISLGRSLLLCFFAGLGLLAPLLVFSHKIHIHLDGMVALSLSFFSLYLNSRYLISTSHNSKKLLKVGVDASVLLTCWPLFIALTMVRWGHYFLLSLEAARSSSIRSFTRKFLKWRDVFKYQPQSAWVLGITCWWWIPRIMQFGHSVLFHKPDSFQYVFSVAYFVLLLLGARYLVAKPNSKNESTSLIHYFGLRMGLGVLLKGGALALLVCALDSVLLSYFWLGVFSLSMLIAADWSPSRYLNMAAAKFLLLSGLVFVMFGALMSGLQYSNSIDVGGARLEKFTKSSTTKLPIAGLQLNGVGWYENFDRHAGRGHSSGILLLQRLIKQHGAQVHLMQGAERLSFVGAIESGWRHNIGWLLICSPYFIDQITLDRRFVKLTKGSGCGIYARRKISGFDMSQFPDFQGLSIDWMKFKNSQQREFDIRVNQLNFPIDPIALEPAPRWRLLIDRFLIDSSKMKNMNIDLLRGKHRLLWSMDLYEGFYGIAVVVACFIVLFLILKLRRNHTSSENQWSLFWLSAVIILVLKSVAPISPWFLAPPSDGGNESYNHRMRLGTIDEKRGFLIDLNFKNFSESLNFDHDHSWGRMFKKNAIESQYRLATIRQGVERIGFLAFGFECVGSTTARCYLRFELRDGKKVVAQDWLKSGEFVDISNISSEVESLDLFINAGRDIVIEDLFFM
jgi:hypothetical protein